MSRVLIVLAALAALWWVRAAESVYTPVLVIGAVYLALWLTFGRGRSIRPLLLYLVGFGAFVQLRALADETGITVHYAYVIDLETALFGVVPSAWLQAHLYEPARATLIDIFAAVVYVSYYFVFHILALLLWLRHRDRFPFYAGAVLLTYYLGLAVSFLLPTAPLGLPPKRAKYRRRCASSATSSPRRATAAMRPACRSPA